MPGISRILACAALVAAAALGSGCSSSGGKPAPPGGGPGDGGDPDISGGPPLWDGTGDPWAGSSAGLLTIGSETVVFAPDYVLSGTVAPGVTALSVALDGGTPAPATISGSTFTLALSLTAGLHGLSLVATDASGAHGPLRVALTYRDGSPTTAELIDAALAASTLTPEQALEYRVYAALGDPGLPTAYRGAGAPDGSAVIAQLWEAEGTLSPAAHAALGRFLIPDFYLESQPPPAPVSGAVAEGAALSTLPWPLCSGADCNLDPSWVSTDGPHVRVWWKKDHPADQPDAEEIVTMIDGPFALWSRLQQLFGHAPAPDGTSGGDARLDIIITDMDGQPGVTETSRSCSAPCPVFIKLQRQPAQPGYIRDAAIHELMHAFTWGGTLAAGKLLAYHAISEATATWAANRYLPIDQWEHRYNDYWLDEPHRGLFTVRDPATDLYPYGTWIFYAWLTAHLNDRTFGDLVISRIWENAATMTDQATIVDQAIRWVTASTSRPETLEDVWPKFVADAWNGGAAPQPLVKLDQITRRPHLSKDAEVTTAYRSAVEAGVTAPGVRYYRWKFPDPSIRTILFLDGAGHRLGTDATAGFRVQAPALFPLGEADKRGITVLGRRLEARATWTWTDPENWTTAKAPYRWDHDGHASDVGYAFLCTEDRAVQELEVAIAYADVSAPGKVLAPRGDPPALVASTAPCFNLEAKTDAVSAWTDDVTGSYSSTRWGYEGSLQSWGLWTDPTDVGSGTLLYGVSFSGQTTKVTWTLDALDGTSQCTSTGSGTVTDLNDMGPLTLLTWASAPDTGAVDWYGYSLSSTMPPADQPYTVSCPPPDPPPPDPDAPPPPPPEPTTWTEYLSVERFELGNYFWVDPVQQSMLHFSQAGVLHLDLAQYFGDGSGWSGTTDLKAAPPPP